MFLKDNIQQVKMEMNLKEIQKRQDLFCSTVRSYFVTKIRKYQNILMKNGIYLSDVSKETAARVSRSQSFDEHIELVLGQKPLSPLAYKSLWKIGNRISATRIFQWIYEMVRRTKATRILHHLDGIPDTEMQTVIITVAQEISVAYEYQLYMLDGDYEVVQLAQHTVLCMLAYLNTTDAHFGPKGLIQAILEVKPQSSRNKEILKTRAVIFNGRPVCLRWRLSQILKQPGLRIPQELEGEKAEKQNVNNKSDRVEAAAAGKDENHDTSAVDEIDFSQPEVFVQWNIRSDMATITRVQGFDKEDMRHESYKEAAEAREDNKEEKVRKKNVIRKINTVEMDFDKSFMNITEHYCEVSDFSPVENTASLLECSDNDSTVGEGYENLAAELEETVDDQEGTNGAKVKLNEKIKNEDIVIQNNDLQGKAQESEETSYKTNVSTDNGIEDSAHGDEKIVDESSHILSAIDHISTVTIPKSSPSIPVFEQQEFIDISSTADVHINSIFSHTVARNDECCQCCAESDEQETALNTELNLEANESRSREVMSVDKEEVAEASKSVRGDENKVYKFFGCFTPYGAKCRPQIYGYRGPLHVWNETEGRYSLIYNDTVTVATLHKREVPINPGDYHQTYSPQTQCKH